MRKTLPKILLLLALAPLGFGAERADAQHAWGAVQSLASLSAGELVDRLREGHETVNAALASRQARYETWHGAVRARDNAAGQVASMKEDGARGDRLESALRSALALDEVATSARSRLLDAEARVARSGADLLRLYNAVLLMKRDEIRNSASTSRERAVRAYNAFSERRDEVRARLRPVLRAEASSTGADLDADAADDIETLLAKADLARDLEERYLRRARAIQRRIAELEEQASLAQDVASLSREQSLFDEDDRRLLITGTLGQGPRARAVPGGAASDQLALAPAPGTVRVEQGGQEPIAEPQPVPAPPSDPDFTDSPEEVESFNGAERVTGAIGTDDAVGASPIAGSTERIFLGSTDADVNALLSSGELDLRALKVLEKQLLQQATRLSGQERDLRSTAESRTRR